MVNIRPQFMQFYHKYRKRRFNFEKSSFLHDYLKCFFNHRCPINTYQKYTIIGDINKAKIIIVCRYDTRKELWVNRHNLYTAKTRPKRDYLMLDRSLRFLFIIISFFIIHVFVGYNFYLIILSVFVSLWVFIGKSNRKNFSSTINLYMIKQLAITESITNDVVFVLYDKKIPIAIFNDHQLIIILEHCAYGNVIGIQSDLDIKQFESSTIKIINSKELVQPLSNYLIINTGFCDDLGFYRLYVDTKQDTSLNITLYRQITELIKRLIYKPYQS